MPLSAFNFRRILIVTDAWRPQINGVVRTLESVGKTLVDEGHEVHYLTPERFWTVPVPTYPEIRQSLATGRAVSSGLRAIGADCIHIATEGPLGLLARQYCIDRKLAFTSSFHLAAEKNIEALLAVGVDGTKIVVGDGPDRSRLMRAYPGAVFLGYRHGAELEAIYRSAGVLVFPSLTDTFGNVITEALASGTPVAAYPVTGPRDVLSNARVGALHADLGIAILRALALNRADARRHAEQFTWRASSRQFIGALTPLQAEPQQRLSAVGS